MQTLKTITFFGTVSDPANSRTSKNGRHDTAFGVASSTATARRSTTTSSPSGKQGQFASKLQKGTRIKLAIQAQSQPDNVATIPFLTATFERPVRPAAS